MGWRMDVAEGWVSWHPGGADASALAAAATGNRMAAQSLARRIRVVEKEVTVLAGDVHLVGVRVADPRTGAVSGSMSLTQWARPVTGGKQLNARRQLTAVEQEVLQEVDDAVTFAQESPYPELRVAFEDLYTEPYEIEGAFV